MTYLSLRDAPWRPGSARRRRRSAAGRAGIVPLAGSLAGLGLLAFGALRRLSTGTVLLATGLVLSGLVRTSLSRRDARALSSARHEARTDELTGLANRRHFYHALRRALAPPMTDGPLAVMLIDLDRFKQVNDRLGHHAGDSVMRMVGQRLRGGLRPEDLLARLGGDEFAVAVGNVDRAAAEATARRLRDAVQAPFVLGMRTLRVDASFGIALVPDHGGDVDQLLERADLAMYAAKSTGCGVETYCPERAGEIADRRYVTVAAGEPPVAGLITDRAPTQRAE